jgi:hypothetical protein
LRRYREYLGNIRKIQRKPTSQHAPSPQREGDEGLEPGVAASWEQSTQTLEVYDVFFTRPEHERPGYLLHEIGHSTYISPGAQETGGFAGLPPRAWMDLSDWKTATSGTLGRELGISADEVTRLINDLRRNKQTQRGRPEPIERNNRMVVYDKYELPWDRPPTRFFHYAKAHADEFVSSYAKTHPAEDLAESFSYYLHDPQVTLLHTGARTRMGDTKWRYLEQNYRRRLQNPRE